MRMLDEITLREKHTTKDADGYPVTRYTERVVYADVLSVSRAEHYAAEGAGTRADIVFVVSADEYGGETELIYAGNTYDVRRTHVRMEARTTLRSYRADPTRTELVCIRR